MSTRLWLSAAIFAISLSGCYSILGTVPVAPDPEPKASASRTEDSNRIYRSDFYRNIALLPIQPPQTTRLNGDKLIGADRWLADGPGAFEVSQQLQRSLHQQQRLNRDGRYQLQVTLQQQQQAPLSATTATLLHYTLTDSHTGAVLLDQTIMGLGIDLSTGAAFRRNASAILSIRDSIDRFNRVLQG
ncbi:hypothetical protein [uncultured Ferrimonas sp.]|uniref:hypothetical protein n=1 Tax=uncultured Ferrimonas sp. TaxID=432640 RepID=UPI0026025989|nr:hypothetical protein [uncultured Ferrimonas sp.]